MPPDAECILSIRMYKHVCLTFLVPVVKSKIEKQPQIEGSDAHLQVAFPQFRETAEQPPSPSLHAYYEVSGCLYLHFPCVQA